MSSGFPKVTPRACTAYLTGLAISVKYAFKRFLCAALSPLTGFRDQAVNKEPGPAMNFFPRLWLDCAVST
ncbi:hypothetical protein BD311DRAFT_675064 [Dichomitus squalens]|uniref:Uncharacterized protein n=1 Tax=Dichomitus squalens TaxID=114155 RepID=A0A4Q9M8Z8_9APHY|nr:hypothetical protein BD311DRAFT_675064 [Dichomitus squalens]